ncbi:hypothetical protein A3Q56_00159 [Intoshia linei]|uniref:SAM domain-containing protein n=1 Tax=Intoshia linei TaxID=1819745 RepID=A0A177BCP3_9BILA|nr:hypothetical protein A3Q56_00159 [Intoshia linei]
MNNLEFLKNTNKILEWTFSDVADFIESIGFGQYKQCFIENFIDGKNLILLNMNNIQKLGITKYQHIAQISKQIRYLLYLNFDDYFKRSISELPRDVNALYVEQKSKTGKKNDKLIYDDFVEQIRDKIWKPNLVRNLYYSK